MNNIEMQFMTVVPQALREIRKVLDGKTIRLVKFGTECYVNPTEVAYVCGRAPDDLANVKANICLTNGKYVPVEVAPDEAIRKLGIEIVE